MAAGADYRIGPYRAVEVLGQGQFGRVYRAHDVRGLEIAVKELRRVSAADRALMRRELEIGRKSISPHVVRILDYDLEGPRPWLAMEFVDGDDLSDLISRRDLTPARIECIARELALGLAALAERHIVHRDLKPANIRIGVADSVKIVDMGLARHASLAATQAGTPVYMAPESLLRGENTHKSDIWSFGAILAEMLTGEVPSLIGGSVARVLSRVPTRWRGLVTACLAVYPEERPTAHEIVSALDPTATVIVPKSPALRPAEPLPVPAQRPSGPTGQPRSASVALALALVLGVYGGHRFYLGHHKQGAIQMFTAGGFLVWLIMDISDILAGRMTDVHGQPLTGRASLRGVRPALYGVPGLLLALPGFGMLVEGDPTGLVVFLLSFVLLALAARKTIATRWKAASERRQRGAADRLTQIGALERELGIAS